MAALDPVSSQLSALLPQLRRRARFLTGNDARADDLVQDTLERALRFRHQFDSSGNLRAWLMRIMTNTFISERRRATTERRVLDRGTHDPNHWVARRVTEQTPGLSPPVERALGELPERLAQTVTLVDLEEGSYRDAATALDVPIGTVMSRLHRGRARLAALLGDAPAAAA